MRQRGLAGRGNVGLKWGVFGLLGAMLLTAPAAFAQSAEKSTQDAKKPSAEVEKYLKDASVGVVRHGLKDPKPRTPGTIRIATYNIENLFDVEQAGDEPGRTPTPAKPAEHRQAIAEAIKRIDADVLAVQEIADKQTLTKFRDEYLKGLGYEHIASVDAGDGRGIEQSVLSRFPIIKEENWPKAPTGQVHPEKLGKRENRDAGKPILLARSPLHAVVEVPAAKTGSGKAYKLDLIVVHHKSGPFHSYQREAETAAVVKLINEKVAVDPNTNVLIMGDFNAKLEENAVKNYTSAGFVSPFVNVDPRDAAFMSHVSGRTIDHILLNPAAAKELAKDSQFVLGTTQRKENVDWRTTPAPAGYASDHYPVVIDLFPVDK